MLLWQQQKDKTYVAADDDGNIYKSSANRETVTVTTHDGFIGQGWTAGEALSLAEGKRTTANTEKQSLQMNSASKRVRLAVDLLKSGKSLDDVKDVLSIPDGDGYTISPNLGDSIIMTASRLIEDDKNKANLETAANDVPADKGKPPLDEVLSIIILKETATALYKRLDTRIALLVAKHGEGRFDYDVSNVEGQETPYLKFELVDNIKKLAEDGHVFTSASVKRYSCVSTGLKRKPESLK